MSSCVGVVVKKGLDSLLTKLTGSILRIRYEHIGIFRTSRGEERLITYTEISAVSLNFNVEEVTFEEATSGNFRWFVSNKNLFVKIELLDRMIW